MANDPLEKVFETPEESLAWYLKQMPASLIPVFQREFMRRPTQLAADGQYLCARCGHPESSHPTAKCAGFARQ